MLGLLSALLLVGSASAASPSAKVKNGTLIGYHSTSYNQDFFLGVPFAQPPLGQLRFNNPVPLNTTFKTKQATSYYPECYGFGVGFLYIS
jgi:carboxylesterase type B